MAQGKLDAPVDPQLFADNAEANSLLALYKRNDSLRHAIITTRKHLIGYICSSRSKSEAINTYALNHLEYAGITLEEMEKNSDDRNAMPANAGDMYEIPGMVNSIWEMQTFIKRNTEQQWQYWLQPVYMLLLFTISFFMGALNRRRNIWALILLMIAFYLLFLLKLDVMLAKANKKDQIDQWFIKLLPVFIETVCCIVLYCMTKSTFHPTRKPASRSSNLPVH